MISQSDAMAFVAVLTVSDRAKRCGAAPDSLTNPPAVEAVLAGRGPVLEALLHTDAPARCGCVALPRRHPQQRHLRLRQRPRIARLYAAACSCAEGRRVRVTRRAVSFS